MKKVIALALAMAMALSMTAMADVLDMDIIADDPTSCGDAPGEDGLLPGNEYHYSINGTMRNLYNEDEEKVVDGDESVDTKYYSISADWDVGSALVQSVKIDNECNHIVVTLKENYTIEDAKDLEGTITLKLKKDYYILTDGNYVLMEKGTKVNLAFDEVVCNNVEDIDGGDNRDDATAIEVADNTIYNVTTSGWFDFGGDGERLSSVLVRLPEDKQVFAYWNEDAIEDIEDKYYDLDADIEYINFVAKPNLGRNAEIAIQGDYSDQYYLYEYVNGDLEPIDADWNEDDGLFEFTASKLTSYVISDKELVAEADEPADDTADEPATDDTTTQNPDTGANDVVGVAVALAAVSLVAAGAVSLKK